MPLDDEGGGVEDVVVMLHRQRRGGHEVGHDGVAEHGADDGGDECRLPGDDAQRSRRCGGVGSLVVARRGGQADDEHDQQYQQIEADDEKKSASKGRGWKNRASGIGEIRADEGGDDASGEHPGNGSRLGGFVGHFHGGEAVVAAKAVEHADQKGARCESPEGVIEHGGQRRQCADDAERRAEHEASAAAPAPHDQRRGNAGQHQPQKLQRQWQCRQRFVRRQLESHQRRDGHH